MRRCKRHIFNTAFELCGRDLAPDACQDGTHCSDHCASPVLLSKSILSANSVIFPLVPSTLTPTAVPTRMAEAALGLEHYE